MARPNYDLKDLLSDVKFIEAVEASPAYPYLSRTFDEGHVLVHKIDLLAMKFKGLNVPGTSRTLPIEDCSHARISQALQRTYQQAQKNVADYQERKAAEWQEKETRWQEIRDQTTLQQHLVALDGYWGRIRQQHDVSTMRRLMQEELDL